MALLTLNLHGAPKDRKVIVPGVRGELLNGYVWDVGDDLPEDTIIGEPLPKKTKPRNFMQELRNWIDATQENPKNQEIIDKYETVTTGNTANVTVDTKDGGE